MKNKKKEISPFNFDDFRQQVPQYYYKRFRVDFTDNTLGRNINWSFPLDFGYGYILREFTCKWPLRDDTNTSTTILDIEFRNIVRGLRYQNSQYPVSLISSPGSSDITFAVSPSPVDLNNFGVSFSSEPVKNKLKYNLYFQFRDTIYITLNFRVPAPFVNNVTYIDLLIMGYLIPDKHLKLWS